jgi:hypothetical protein
MLVLTRATQRNIPEYSILHSYGHENINLYILSILREGLQVIILVKICSPYFETLFCIKYQYL